jgi:flagellar motor protein MotB
MIQNQDSEVNIKYNNNNNDINTRNAVDNWKLAVRRALDQARR